MMNEQMIADMCRAYNGVLLNQPEDQRDQPAAMRAAHSVMAGKVAELERERSFVWKWIERAIFDKGLSTDECLSTLAGYPGAPWMNGRWDVDHKPYAAQFYKRFPRAALAPYPERRSE